MKLQEKVVSCCHVSLREHKEEGEVDLRTRQEKDVLTYCRMD